MATIAVFVSLGGASYAALNLPRNSVGAKQIREGAVRASEVRNRSLGLTELQRKAVSALKGQRGDTGAPGPPGKDAAPADFAGEAAMPVAAAPVGGNQCAVVAQFCTGGNNWSWRNYGNGYQAVGFWKDRGGVVHLEGVAELFGGAGGGQPAALRFVEIRPDGQVDPELGGGGVAPLDGISFRP